VDSIMATFGLLVDEILQPEFSLRGAFVSGIPLGIVGIEAFWRYFPVCGSI
jgi:hypothetical protein